MGRHSTGNFLIMQCWPRQIDPDKIVDYFSVQSCSWAVGINTAQVILLCNVGAGRSKQHCIGYFPAKTCLHALDQHWHCTSNFLVQCCLRCRTILTRQYSYAMTMLSQHGQYNIVQVIFLIKGVCLPWTNILHTQVISLCNVGPERSGQYCSQLNYSRLHYLIVII